MADSVQEVIATINSAQASSGTASPAPAATPAPIVTPTPNPVATPDPNSEAARNAAFAQMRIENTKLQTELEALKKQLTPAPAAPSTTQLQQQTAPDPQAELTKRLAALEQREQERISNARQEHLIGELTGLRNKYALGPEQLQQFAKDAASQGVDLRNTDRSFESIYRDIHFVELIEAEVNRRLRPGQPSVPGTGPQGGGTGGKPAQSIAEVIAAVTKATTK